MTEARSLINAIAHRVPRNTNLYPAINTAIGRISKRLFFHKSDIITGALNVSISADSDNGSLPTDFWGLMGKPYISGKTWALEPLPSKETKLAYSSNAVPTYYQIKGQTIYLIPGSSSAITINGDYFQKQTEITKPTDTIPFYGMFDDAIQEFLIKWFFEGSKGKPNDTALLLNYIDETVDTFIPLRDKGAPPEVPGGIDWLEITDDAMFP